MLQLNLKDRVKLYRVTYPKRSPLHIQNGCIEGVWKMGRNYNGNGYHGSYPASYLPRIKAMFPDAGNILHLFSGAIGPGDYTRFDLHDNTDIQGDAHKLSEYFEPESFDLIIADPPYTGEDADKYGTPMVRRQTVLKEALKALQPNGVITWLDQVWPNYSKQICQLVGTISILVSTNHRCRMSYWYMKSLRMASQGEILSHTTDASALQGSLALQ